VGRRCLAFAHPDHGPETLEAYFAVFPQGIFVSEDEDRIMSPMPWSDATGDGTTLAHDKDGTWLYVSRLAFTAGPGHAPVLHEIAPLLIALQQCAVRFGLQGVAFPTRFRGLRERSGTTAFQASVIDD
jgi:hypothetical protein